MSTELKPCPFCGNQPALIDEYDKRTGSWCAFSIQCDNCTGIHGERGDQWCSDTGWAGDNLKTVVAAWNKRVE